MPQLLENFRALARYNRWMNEKFLFESSNFSDAVRKAPSGAPFGSLHGVWNHLLLTYKAWLSRMGGEPFAAKTLADELYSDWDEFKTERARSDEMIEAHVAALTPDKLSENLVWTAMSVPKQFSMPLHLVLTHVFNHQTHHRGQISALIEQNGGDCGVTDFLMMPDLPFAHPVILREPKRLKNHGDGEK